MGTKEILRLLVFALVLTMFTKHQVLGDQECYGQKTSLKYACMETIKLGGAYEPPTGSCRCVVRKSDLTCICRIFNIQDESEISIAKFLRLARECGKQVTGIPKCGSNFFYYYHFD
jgi:hypothetical protein